MFKRIWPGGSEGAFTIGEYARNKEGYQEFHLLNQSLVC